jgi:hypothetical protein
MKRMARIAVISAARPDNVPVMLKHLAKSRHEVAWFVGADDRREYEAAGARNVFASGGLIAARNAALDWADEGDSTCVQVSDDLVDVSEFDAATRKAKPWSLRAAIDVLVENANTAGARLAGIPPTANAFYASREVKAAAFCIGDLFACRRTPLRFSHEVPTKEDYDWTCKHLSTHGAVARCDWILAKFRHYDGYRLGKRPPAGVGGNQALRTIEFEQQAADALMRRWPHWIKPHPKNRGEVVLRARAKLT